METSTVEGLIRDGESLEIEFKSEKKRQLSDRDLYEAVVCLANGQGGVLLIGVEDDNTVTGARTRHGTATEPHKLQAAINNNTIPSVSTVVSVRQVKGKDVVTIEVPRAQSTCATRDGKCLRRVQGVHGPECQPYYPHEHGRRHTRVSGLDFSAQTLDEAAWTDLNPLEFERLRQTIKQKGGDSSLLALDDAELAKALGLVTTRKNELLPTMTGLLLVGREDALKKRMPTHKLALQVLDVHGDVHVNDWLQTPLLRTLEYAEDRFKTLNTEKEAKVGLVRMAVPDYSPDAFREALLNAVQHRDYSILNAVYVQLHPDHLLITSPGGFLEGITLENLLVHEPLPRNGRLSETLRRIGLVETTGRGIDKIFMGQLRYGRAAPDYSRSDSNAVRVMLAGGKISSAFAVFVAEQEKKGPLSLDDLLILDHLRHERRIDSVTAGKLTQKGATTARASLERLAEAGLVEAKGEKRGRVYHLSASLYTKLGQKVAYVRTHGFNRIRQEAMVLDFIKAYGKIARRDAAELCSLSGPQAYRLLDRLVHAGKIRMLGKKRGASYVLV